MNPNEQYVMSQVGPMLGPGEQVLHLAIVRRAPGLLMQMFLLGGLLGFLMTKFYWAALTNRRMILIRSKVGIFSFTGTPAFQNLGVEEWDARGIQKVTVSGFANNRSMTFVTQTGKQTIRIAPWMKAIPGTKMFFEQIPNLVNSGQLSQMANQLGGGAPMGGQPPQMGMGGGGYGAPPQMQMQQQQQQTGGYGAPPQQAAYGAPPQPPQAQYGAPPPQAFAPGMQVTVTDPSGNRYPATIVQEQQGHFLCASSTGQNWVPAQYLSRS